MTDTIPHSFYSLFFNSFFAGKETDSALNNWHEATQLSIGKTGSHGSQMAKPMLSTTLCGFQQGFPFYSSLKDEPLRTDHIREGRAEVEA